MAERSDNRGDDLVSVLLRGDGRWRATARRLHGLRVRALVAGGITTAYLIGSAVVALHRDLGLWFRVRSDTGLIGRVAEETLRHEAPVQIMFRTATTAVDIAGVALPRARNRSGTDRIHANRDEAVFAA